MAGGSTSLGREAAGRWFAETVPEAHRAMARLDGALWLDPTLRQLVRIRTSQLNGCASAVERHERETLELGESARRLGAVATWRRSPLFSERERAALELAEALALQPGGPALDAALRRAGEQMEEYELGQLVFACAAGNAWDRLLLATIDTPR